MNSENLTSLYIRVNTIRSQNPKGFGGCIFSAYEISREGRIIDAKKYVVVKASWHLLNEIAVNIGQHWEVSGHQKETLLIVNGYRLTEVELTAKSMILIKPSGEHIVSYLSNNTKFIGIGEVKARDLWNAFGNELYDYLDKGNKEKLSSVLSDKISDMLIKAWKDIGASETLQWLQAHGFSINLGQKVIGFFGNNAKKMIEEDPYRLLSFEGSWKKVDAIALNKIGLSKDDPRRLLGAIEETCYRILDNGSTCLPIQRVIPKIKALLGSENLSLVKSALDKGTTNGGFIYSKFGLLHPIGPFIMETYVADFFMKALNINSPLLPEAELNNILNEHNKIEPFPLNEAQTDAVSRANIHGFSVIIGGAGTGKTTVIKALHRIFDKAKIKVFQVALSGKATKRMHQSTSRPALTIAGFTKKFKYKNLIAPMIIIIDESSMVDILSLYRLCRILPEGTRLVFVGDPYQLPPVGPGLTLHELTNPSHGELFNQGTVTITELTEVHRHGNEIASFANLVRHGSWPDNLTDNIDSPVCFLNCPNNRINQVVCDLIKKDPDQSQILCSIKNSVVGGSKILNKMCQSLLSNEDDELTIINNEFNMFQKLGFRLNDPVICSRNLWDIDLQNGSMGRIIEINDKPDLYSKHSFLGKILWDNGVIHDINPYILEDIDLAYSITIHKSQGSQFQRIIIPIISSRILDRTLIYTAITRAQSQVILVGNEAIAKRAVEENPKVSYRHVSLGMLLWGN